MKTTAYGTTDIGMHRRNNEDCFLIDEALGLYLVCDGLGGHAAGEIASRMAAQALCERLTACAYQLAVFEKTNDLRGAHDLVVKAVKHASRIVREEGEVRGQAGMGTTMTLLLAIGDRAVIASVGDSRAYHCRKTLARLLTRDHTLAREMIIAGELSPEQARQSPFQHYLTRTVGSNDDVEVDTLVAHLIPGDIFLLCTDGLTRYFESDKALGEYMFHEPCDIPQELVAYANSRGGKDNITALVVHVEEGTREALPRDSRRKWFTRVALV